MTDVRHGLYALLARDLPLAELCHELEQFFGELLNARASIHLPAPLYRHMVCAPSAAGPADGNADDDRAVGRPQWASAPLNGEAGEMTDSGDDRLLLLPIAIGRRSTALLGVHHCQSLAPAMRKFIDEVLPMVAVAIRHSLRYQRQRQAINTFATRLRATRTLEHLRHAAQRVDVSHKQLANELHSILIAALRPADPRLLVRVRIGRSVCADPGFRLSRLAGKAEFNVEGRLLGDVQTMLAPVAPEEIQWLSEISSHLRSTLLGEASRQITIGLMHRQLLECYRNVCRSERRRLARELHDGVGPTLTGVAMLAASLQQRLAGTDEQASVIAADLARAASQAVRQVRDYSHQQARSAAPGDLREALGQVARQTRGRYGIRCRLDMQDEVAKLKRPELISNLSAIAQEAIVNAARHGRADGVHLRLEKSRQQVVFTISDDGCGFDAQQQTHDQLGIGLDNIRQRAADLGGRLTIQAHPGKGTTLHCRFPAHYFFAEAEDCAIWRP